MKRKLEHHEQLIHKYHKAFKSKASYAIQFNKTISDNLNFE